MARAKRIPIGIKEDRRISKLESEVFISISGQVYSGFLIMSRIEIAFSKIQIKEFSQEIIQNNEFSRNPSTIYIRDILIVFSCLLEIELKNNLIGAKLTYEKIPVSCSFSAWCLV
jgi:hypothetical protein